MYDISSRLICKLAGCNRAKEVRIQECVCDLCGNTSNGISSDTSEGKYGHIHLCFKCLRQLTEEFEGSIAD